MFSWYIPHFVQSEQHKVRMSVFVAARKIKKQLQASPAEIEKEKQITRHNAKLEVVEEGWKGLNPAEFMAMPHPVNELAAFIQDVVSRDIRSDKRIEIIKNKREQKRALDLVTEVVGLPSQDEAAAARSAAGTDNISKRQLEQRRGKNMGSIVNAQVARIEGATPPRGQAPAPLERPLSVRPSAQQAQRRQR